MNNLVKNPTPQQIAIYSALLISIILGLLIGILTLIGGHSSSWLSVFVILGGCFLSSYLLITYFLKNYIYRKIKLIYKSIRSTKVSSVDKAEDIDLRKDMIDEVEREVEEWAQIQNKEIESLKAMETYRRNFLGNISHELKTPIFNIQGYIHTLLEGGLYDETINKSFLTKAANNVERLQTIVQDLEEISRLESGEQKLNIQKFTIRDLSLEVIEDLEMLAAESNITLKLKSGAEENFTVNADREKIRQVLMNLVTNSIKYGKENGKTQIGFYDLDTYILIEVADDGIGIEKEQIGRVFERFYRTDKSRSRQGGGSGLGLSIVKHIIEAHQQTINLRSTKGLGSTFGFTLEKVKG